jgi:hypothetical protein
MLVKTSRSLEEGSGPGLQASGSESLVRLADVDGAAVSDSAATTQPASLEPETEGLKGSVVLGADQVELSSAHPVLPRLLATWSGLVLPPRFAASAFPAS